VAPHLKAPTIFENAYDGVAKRSCKLTKMTVSGQGSAVLHGRLTDIRASSADGRAIASLKQGLGDEISPLKANQLRNLAGSRVRFNGTNAIGDEVKPAYKAVYSSLKTP
jgi:hypothetical protein